MELSKKLLNKEAIVKAVKEVGRVVFFGGLSALALYITTLLTNLNPGEVQFIILTVIGRALDKYVYENENINKGGGIAPF